MKKIFAMMLALAVVTAAGVANAATPLVDVAWVKSNLGKPGVVFLDVGGKLGGKSKANFLRGHIPGAVWTNYLKDGWRSKDKNKTVGQLSPTPKLEKLIGGLGIGNDDHVVLIWSAAKRSTSTADAPKRKGKRTSAPRPKVNASGGVAQKISSGPIAKTLRAKVSAEARRSR